MSPKRFRIPGPVLLSGVVGSTAYGLAGPNSDIDTLTTFAWPTEELYRIIKPPESIVSHEPDVTRHEIEKYCRLALGCNPTAIELLWLEDYTEITKFGQQLIDIRRRFLSAKKVRDAYLGYATQQLSRLNTQKTKDKAAKNARHLYRLLFQGLELYSEGTLPIRLKDPDKFITFGNKVAEGDVDLAKSTIREYESRFDNANCALHQEPMYDEIDSFLVRVRYCYL